MIIPNEHKIVSVEEMVRIEHDADAAGHSYDTMMELAGNAVAQAVLEQAKTETPSVLILVGPGNNGGDGLVCARALFEAGATLCVYIWKRHRITDTVNPIADKHLHHLHHLKISLIYADDDPALLQLEQWLQKADIVVDALLGTGSNRPITGQLADILVVVRQYQMNHNPSSDQPKGSKTTYLSVDCPSGLHCDRGTVDPHLVSADRTITFGYAKQGHYRFPGAETVGRLEVADIGISPQIADDIRQFCLSADWVRTSLPKRSNDSHKGTFGKVMAAVGSVNYPGAAYLACAAAARIGAGLVTGAIPEPIWTPVAIKLTEATWLPLPTESGFIAQKAAETMKQFVAAYSALLVGCGLGQAEGIQGFLLDLLQNEQLPSLVLDADGLNNLAQVSRWWEYLPPQTILTPHPAEMARLCQQPLETVRSNRWELAREKAEEWNVILLLKGPYIVIAHPDGTLAILPIATPALASAGTGDVLAGTIAGLLAQGVSPFEAACLGAWLHGQAGLQCAKEIGQAGVLASDVLARLPTAIERLHTA